MQFGDFLFPYNPKSIQVLTQKQVKSFATVDGGIIVREKANSPVKVVCRGEFFGENAQESYNKLRMMCFSGEAQVLSIPAHSSFYAVCTKVEFLGSGGGNVIPYYVEFFEKR